MTYIEREALLEKLRGECVAKYPVSFYFGLFAAADEVAKAPAADVVKVVRCRECKYYSFDNGAKWCVLHKGLAMVLPDAFCSYGEKRED